MTRTFGPRSPEYSVLDHPAAILAFALLSLEPDVSRGLLGKALAQFKDSPHDLCDLGRLASIGHLDDVALSAITLMLQPIEPSRRLLTPYAIEQLAYPTPFASELLEAAAAEGIPPLLLAALARQESAFNPRAGSLAGALGLTQVIPPTGEEIASSLGVPWLIDDLFDPRTSLRFGAHYLAMQLKQFDGNVVAALAAYNGGPGNARRWLNAQPFPGALGYSEAVDFSETQDYLGRVIENYAWYRYLYAGAPRPAMR